KQWKKFERQKAGKKPIADRLSDRIRDLAVVFRDRATKIDQAQNFGHTAEPTSQADEDEAEEMKSILIQRHFHMLEGVHSGSELPADLRMKAEALERAANEIQNQAPPYKLNKSEQRGCFIFILMLLAGAAFLFTRSEPWWAVAVILFAGICVFM